MDLKKNVQKLIAKGQTKHALRLLYDYFEDNDLELFHKIVLLSGQYQDWENNKNLGLPVKEETLPKINRATLMILEEFEGKIEDQEDLKKLVKNVKADTWFKNLIERLKIATSLSAYLREFQAPEETWLTRRKQILTINEQFVRLIHEHTSTTRIIGYFPENLSDLQNPLHWLTQQAAQYNQGDPNQALIKVNQSVKLVSKQPTANSYTVYLIDNSRLFYNFLTQKGDWEFFDIDLNTSIIPYFLNLGFDKFMEGLSKL